MNSLTTSAVLSILPISELRGGIPFAIASGVSPLVAFILCTVLNIIIIFPIFFFLDNLHAGFMKWGFYRKSFNFYLDRVRNKVRARKRNLSYFLLFLFVAIPFVGTGGYTGVLISWFFKMNRKKSYLVISLGVLSAGVLVTFASLGILGLF